MPYEIIETTKIEDVVIAPKFADNAIATGNRSVAIASGIGSQARANYKDAVAIAIGDETAAIAAQPQTMAIGNAGGTLTVVKGVIGSWLVLTDWDTYGHLNDVITVKVDGILIKPDVCYTFQKGCIQPAYVEDRNKYPIVEVTTNLKELDKSAAEAKGLYIPHEE